MTTKTDQYKNLYKEQKAETAHQQQLKESLSKELIQANETISILSLRLHLLRYTPWWKIWKLIRIIRKLRQS